MNRESKFISRLKELNKKEFIEFGEYIMSPFFKIDKKIGILYAAVQSCWPRIKESEIDENSQVRKAFSKTSVLKVYKTKLLKTLDEYLAQTYFREQKDYQHYFLLEKLRLRKFDDAFEAKYNKYNAAFKNQASSKGFEKDHFLFKFKHEYSFLEFISEKRKSPVIGKQYEKLLTEFDHHFLSNRFFIINVIFQYHIMNSKTGININDDFLGLVEDILSSTNKPMFRNVPAIEAQRLSFNLLKEMGSKEFKEIFPREKKGNHFEELLNYLDKHNFEIPRNQCEFAYRVLVNHAVNETRYGGQETYIQLNELYTSLEKRRYFQEGSKVRTNRLKSAFVTAIKAGSHIRATELEEKYLNKIEQKKKHELELYFKGYKSYFSASENHSEARNYFDECWKLKGGLWIDAFAMYAKICFDVYMKSKDAYYENTVFGNLIPNTIRRIEDSSKEGESYKKSYINFLKIIIKIFKTIGVYKPSYTEIQKILNDDNVLISDRQWLRARLLALEM